MKAPSRKDYPIAETNPASVKGGRGKPFNDITLDAVMRGDATMEDLRITPDALRAQAGIARAVNRPTLAKNFERAAELVDVPQDFIMEVYELLRPGRAQSGQDLFAAAKVLRETYNAVTIAAFIEEAAQAYEERGLYTKRF